jgi:hypothetical protein
MGHPDVEIRANLSHTLHESVHLFLRDYFFEGSGKAREAYGEVFATI